MKANRIFLVVILAIVGALLAVSLLGSMNVHLGSFEFNISLEIFDHGFTEFRLPPLGSIGAKTHQSPLKIIITLTNIDFQAIKQLLELDIGNPTINQDITQAVNKEVSQIINRYVIRILLLAAIGSGFLIVILGPNKRSSCLIGMLVGTLLMGGLLYQTYRTYDVNQFQNPEFRGMLEAAPWMMSFAQEAIVAVDELGYRLQVIAENLFEVYQTIDTLELRQPLATNLRVLHVSDIHNNPAAFDFVKQISTSFKADFIINTGDETDFGTPLENIIFQQIRDLKVPYIFIGGNHDSQETLNAMEKIENVILLDQAVTQIRGLNIYGFSDPASKTPDLTAIRPEEVAGLVSDIHSFIEERGKEPHIIAVHNHRLATSLAGTAPIIMHGHDHRVAISQVGSSIILDAGTSGAAGIRGLQTVNETPYSVLMLHFNIVEEEISLVAVDVFKVFNLKTGFTLERNTFNKVITTGIAN